MMLRPAKKYPGPDPFGIDCESNADGTSPADDPRTRHDLSTRSVPHCGKVDTLRQWSRMPTTKFQAIAGDARVGYVVIELAEFSSALGWKTMRHSIAYLAFACFA